MHAKNHLADQESLQADVMRFMAIIALSLVAIMSLVSEAVPESRPDEREAAIAPTPVELPPEPAVPEIVVPAPTRTVAKITPNPEPIVVRPSIRRPATPKPDDTPKQRTAFSTNPAPPRDLPEPVETIETQAPPRVEQERRVEQEPFVETPKRVREFASRESAKKPARSEPQLSIAPPSELVEPAPPTETPADEGLQLRFQSEKAFLRLVARGEIDVYAYRPGEVLRLNQQFALQPSPAPGEVYNLAVATVPEAIRRGARDSGFTWAVALPAPTRRAIQRHIERRASGVIEIQSSGAVRHVPSR